MKNKSEISAFFALNVSAENLGGLSGRKASRILILKISFFAALSKA